MTTLVEGQDARPRVNTLDPAVASYTAKKLKYIDPDGIADALDATVEDSTYLAADIDKSKLKRGWWRFAAEAVDLGGKLRKTIWFKVFVKGEGEVVQE